MADNKRVLLMSSDILPLPGFPTTGSGLRAWGLGKGLEGRGHRVFYSMPAQALSEGRHALASEEIQKLTWNVGSIRHLLDYAQPDVLIVCNWPVLAMIPDELDIPVALDQHGPHLLERYYQNYGQFNLNVRDKLNAFRKADFFTCAGQKQRLYFLPWLMQAGFDVACDRYASIPVSLSPQLPSHESTGDLSFVYGGVFLPWQDPSLALSVLVKVLEQREQGQLLLFGGKHPLYPVDTGIFESLKSRLQISSRVSYRTMLARDELIKIYTHAHVAMDLMARNPERELAFTTRTVEYLWCGLPVIYNNYAELSTWIREYNAGWILDPMDANTIQHTIHSIVDRPEKTSERGRNAQQLVYEQLTWDRTIAPLDQFVRAPTKLLRRSHNIAAPALATQAAASANHKTFGQLVDEAILHYRRGGMKTLTCETIGFLKRKLTLR